jgi:hypothetical protein
MNRPWLKFAVAAIVAFMMLYYSVAWAVLRCEHREVHLDYRTVLNDGGSHRALNSLRLPILPEAKLDCQDGAFHFESLAGPSTSSALLRQLRETTPQTPNYSPPADRERDEALIVRRGTLPERGISPPVATNLPRYLLISILRF